MSHNAWPANPNRGVERKHTVEVLERTQDLTSEMLRRLLDCSRGVFTVNEGMQERFLKGIVSRGGRIHYVLDAKGEVAGYGASERIIKKSPKSRPVSGYYFSNGVVRKESRGQGIHHDINYSLISEVIAHKGSFFRFATQNPNVESNLRNVLGEFINGNSSPIASYEVVISRTYTKDHRPVTQEKPEKSGVKSIDDQYATLDYGHGETFVVTINIEYSNANVR